MKAQLADVKERVRREFGHLGEAIRPSMPVLEEWVDRQKGERPLAGVTALLIQHQVGNQVPQAKALIELGLHPKRIVWLDVPYTSNPKVRSALQTLGIPERNFRVHDYRVLDPYGPYQLRRVQTMLHRLLDHPPDRLLVLDDGAYFLEAMATIKSRLPNVAIVEQTTRGLIKIQESAALRRCARDVPIVNVARSGPKKKLESPFIGLAVCHALRSRLRKASFHLRSDDRCLILGYGAVGRSVAEYLAETLRHPRARIHVQDPVGSRVAEAERRGFARWDRNDFETLFRLVIGCSGRASFRVGDYVYLKRDAVLASASSGSVELSRQDFIDLADSSDLDDVVLLRKGLDVKNVHSDLHFRLVDREVTFLNGGFPVNFGGQVNCVPTRFMQATATLMVAGAVQAAEAMTTRRTGLLRVAPDFCAWLDRSFRRELGEEAVLITTPPAG